MSSTQAALGLAQLERIDELTAKKRQIFEWYRTELGSVDGLTLNYELPGTKNSYWMVTAIPDERYNLPKLRLMEMMAEQEMRPFFYPRLPSGLRLQGRRRTMASHEPNRL